MFYSLSDSLECRSQSPLDNKGLRLTEPVLKTVQAPDVGGLMMGNKFIRTTNTYRTVPIYHHN